MWTDRVSRIMRAVSDRRTRRRGDLRFGKEGIALRVGKKRRPERPGRRPAGANGVPAVSVIRSSGGDVRVPSIGDRPLAPHRRSGSRRHLAICTIGSYTGANAWLYNPAIDGRLPGRVDQNVGVSRRNRHRRTVAQLDQNAVVDLVRPVVRAGAAGAGMARPRDGRRPRGRGSRCPASAGDSAPGF